MLPANAKHAYKQGINKAFIHLFLTWDAISELLGEEDPIFTRVEKNPIEAYRWWFQGFNIIKEREVGREPISKFFLVESFKELVVVEQQLKEEDVEKFFSDMEIQFVDYILEK